MDAPDTASPRGPRVTLKTLLWLTAVAACAIVIAIQARELGPLRAEVQRLRDEVGDLVVRDPSRVYALEVATEDTFTQKEWRWRVWWPEGRTMVLSCSEEPIPADGFPSTNGQAWLEGGSEYTVRYVLRQDRKLDRWVGQFFYRRSGGSEGSFGGSTIDWYGAGKGGAAFSGGVGMQTESFAADEPVVITRYRAAGDSKLTSSNDIPDPAPGFMIWLEPVP